MMIENKQGFFRALIVFFCCVIVSIAIGFIFDILQIAVTCGVGLGLLWMGVAYFNQKEN